jgi:hypothetical protein
MMQHYQIADQLDPLHKPKDQSKSDKDESNKSSEKQMTKSLRPSQRKMILMFAHKKSCLIHGPDSSHMTNECQTMRKQAY